MPRNRDDSGGCYGCVLLVFFAIILIIGITLDVAGVPGLFALAIIVFCLVLIICAAIGMYDY